jgi:ribonuclease R
MIDFETRILNAISDRKYKPIKAKTLFRQMELDDGVYPDFRNALRSLIRQGRASIGKNSTVRPADPLGTAIGIFRRMGSGSGVVRTHLTEDRGAAEYNIADYHTLDASSGDEVLIRVLDRPTRATLGVGEIIDVKQRATKQFVGTYFERDGDKLVRVDGTVFSRSLIVSDADTKGVQPDDKVVVEVLKFPTIHQRGEAVIVEVLGKRGIPRVDTLSTVRALGIPDTFPEEVLAEARAVAAKFHEDQLGDREDFTNQLVITVDPVDAKDFDDAVSLTIDPKSKHWLLTVHIADVAHFVKRGGALDQEARKRGNSVYLPMQVIPMFPELISNGLASLQGGKIRYVKTAEIEFTAAGEPVTTRFANGAIRVKKRFAYEHVSEILADSTGERAASCDTEIVAMLLKMRELALILRKRRAKRGALEMDMPEPVLDYDKEGHVVGAHFAVNDISHQIIEEFMLSANEAVARQLDELKVSFIRRVHPAPDPVKLKAFAEFTAILGYPISKYQDRFELQRVLRETADKPERHAIHYSMLRSLKQARYSAEQDEHYALATQQYCHFTSPIRRYPDLTIHRLLSQWIDRGAASANLDELHAIAEQCSRTERRAESAEREIVKLRILNFLADRVGMKLDGVITGVAEYGFFAQGAEFPAEGLVHVSSLSDDYYHYDEASHTLEGKRTLKRYRLGDRVRVEVVRSDVARRQLDFRIVGSEEGAKAPRAKKKRKKPKD